MRFQFISVKGRIHFNQTVVVDVRIYNPCHVTFCVSISYLFCRLGDYKLIPGLSLKTSKSIYEWISGEFLLIIVAKIYYMGCIEEY